MFIVSHTCWNRQTEHVAWYHGWQSGVKKAVEFDGMPPNKLSMHYKSPRVIDLKQIISIRLSFISQSARDQRHNA